VIGGLFAPMPYSLVTLPTIKSWADLKGKAVTLATKQDVTAVVFTQMAAPHGLGLDDFSIVSGGTSNVRYAALASGNVQAAILTQPFDLIAEAAGMKILATAHDAMKDWTFSSIAVNQTWAAANRPTVVKVLRALRKAIRYGYTHEDQSIALLVALTHADPDIVRRAYELDFTRWHAFDDGFHLSDVSLRYIEKLQAQLGSVTSAPSLSEVYDPSYAAEATR
jgi:ABC-type nitrate/sulfonate/bicarbonate transport system substrate-binding protein